MIFEIMKYHSKSRDPHMSLGRILLTINRVAVHFDSAKTRKNDRTLYELLRKVTVSQSSGISKSISLIQDQKLHTVERNRANFHLEEIDGHLGFFVSTNKRERELCFLHDLPKRMLTFLSIYDINAEAVIVQVLACSNLDTLDALLESMGIIEIEGIARDRDEIDTLGEALDRSLSLPGDQKETTCSTAPERTRSSISPRKGPSPLGPTQDGVEDCARHDSVVSTSRSSPSTSASAATAGRVDNTNIVGLATNLTSSCSWTGFSQDGNQGTSSTPSQEYVEVDVSTGQITQYATITMHRQFHNFSLEELRLKDYSDGRGRPPTTPKSFETSAVPQTDTGYGELLNGLIKKVGELPHGQAFPRNGQVPSEPAGLVVPEFCGPSPIDRYIKLVAAGELFVSVLDSITTTKYTNSGASFRCRCLRGSVQ